MDKYHDCGHRLRIHDKRLRQTANSGLVDRAGRMPLPLGTETPHGTVTGVRFDGVERYYFLRSNGSVAFMPADVIEGHPTVRDDRQLTGHTAQSKNQTPTG